MNFERNSFNGGNRFWDKGFFQLVGFSASVLTIWRFSPLLSQLARSPEMRDILERILLFPFGCMIGAFGLPVALVTNLFALCLFVCVMKYAFKILPKAFGIVGFCSLIFAGAWVLVQWGPAIGHAMATAASTLVRWGGPISKSIASLIITKAQPFVAGTISLLTRYVSYPVLAGLLAASSGSLTWLWMAEKKTAQILGILSCLYCLMHAAAATQEMYGPEAKARLPFYVGTMYMIGLHMIREVNDLSRDAFWRWVKDKCQLFLPTGSA